jgi:hypothetical protein
MSKGVKQFFIISLTSEFAYFWIRLLLNSLTSEFAYLWIRLLMNLLTSEFAYFGILLLLNLLTSEFTYFWIRLLLVLDLVLERVLDLDLDRGSADALTKTSPEWRLPYLNPPACFFVWWRLLLCPLRFLMLRLCPLRLRLWLLRLYVLAIIYILLLKHFYKKSTSVL